jgi:diguanylate cyclase (GGDEF)-like protein
MPGSSDPLPLTPVVEDSYLDLLVETIESLEEGVRGHFLRQLFHTMAHVDISEAHSNQYWDLILTRRRELSRTPNSAVSLKTAIVDVFTSTNLLRVPILVEYEEFKKLKLNAATDALTGLNNRRLFDELCEKELTRAKRYGQHLALVILDVHKLKDVNDRYGHLQGDNVLQLAATTLNKTLRASDSAFRIGGDEFAFLLPQSDLEQAVTLCRRVRAQYESEVRPFQLDIPVTLDFGVAIHPQDGDSKSQLMAYADKKLYELKDSGRTSRRSTPITMPTPAAAPAPTPTSNEGQSRPAVTPMAAPTVVPAMPSGGASLGVPAGAPATTATARSVAAGPDQRKWERVALVGTKAHAILTDLGQRAAKVVDLSYGGVALLIARHEEIPNQFNAVLHVPILPPVRVVLRKTYTQKAENDLLRVGCAFVS